MFILLIFLSLIANLFAAVIPPTTIKSVTTTTTKTSAASSVSSDPSIIYWKKSTGFGLGNGSKYINNVNKIQYSSSYIYITANSIPAYSIGPWAANPNSAGGMNYTFKIPRTPTVPSTKTSVPLGHFGVWIDGVSMYNAWDAVSYNNLGVWQRNAYVWEKISFDSCNGHPDGGSEYHIHVNPVCLYSYNVSSAHSPLIGFAFDGYPVYGSYAYSSANNTASSIKLMVSSYALRNITLRTTLSNGTTLSSAYYGPPVNSTYPLGSYLQDYQYVSGYGDLDAYNGRYGKTPEYPSGTYAYFATVDSTYTPQYPFIIGPSFYGAPVSSNMGTGSGSASITETVTTYYSYTSSG